MSNLADILRQKNFSEPPEMTALKHYIEEHFHSSVQITIQPESIVISTGSAALANTLRMHDQELIKVCNSTKRLIFRIN